MELTSARPKNGILPFRYAWVVVAVSFLTLVTATGARSTFGVFLQPLQTAFGASSADVALIASISILVNGANQPIIGHLLDRYGARTIAVICLAIGAAGLVASSMTTGLWQMYITFGIVVSVAVGGPSTTMASVISARWFAKHRGLVMGILSAGNSAGQVILIPLAMQLNLAFGWRQSYVLMGLGMAALLVPIGLLLRNDPREMGKQPYGAGEAQASARTEALEETRKTPLLRALHTRPFWLLATGFFVCGFTGSGTVSTHLVAYTTGRGIEPGMAAAALGIIGGVSLMGTIFVGFLTDHVGRKNPLAAVYFIRGTALIFLIFVDDPVKLNIFAVFFGLGHFATVPPTSALVAHFYGRLSVGVLFGAVFTIHQIGGAIGSYSAGLLRDMTGNYYNSLIMAVVLCYIASAVSFSIRERPLAQATSGIVQRTS